MGRPSEARRPRLGFAGVGWIGRNRLQAVQESEVADVFAIADPIEQQRYVARQIAPAAIAVASVHELLELPLDGVVIATPSALHAEQAMSALDRGLAVFCQKPLGRSAAEARAVVDAARAANRLLGVDFSYRFTAAAQCAWPMPSPGWPATMPGAHAWPDGRPSVPGATRPSALPGNISKCTASSWLLDISSRAAL